MKTQPSNWLQMSDALKTLAAGFEKVDAVERNGGFKLPQIGTIPTLNGKANGHTNGHAAAAKALPAPQKVKKAALKALPAPAAEAKPAKKAKTAPIVKAKPAKVEKVAKTKAKAAPANANAIAIGRRAVANGERPKLVEAIAIVMGSETMTAGGILELLVARGWAPGASNPQSYISYTLSDNEEVFKRGKRGEYSVKSPKNYVELAAQWKSGKVAKTAAKETAKAAPKAKAAAAPKAKKAKGSKTSKKAEGVASTDTDVTEVLTTAVEPEVVQEPVVEAEAASVAGDPPTTTPDATVTAAPSTPSTDEALQDLGLEKEEVGSNPFDALT